MRVLGAVLSRSAGSERVRPSFSLCEGQRDALSVSSGRGSPSPAAAPCRVRAAVSACVRARVGLRAQRCTHTHTVHMWHCRDSEAQQLWLRCGTVSVFLRPPPVLLGVI